MLEERREERREESREGRQGREEDGGKLAEMKVEKHFERKTGPKVIEKSVEPILS